MTDLLSPTGMAELRDVASSQALLAFDFDGTLAPIVQRSHAAAMRPRTRRLLAQVARRFPCAIISGRRLSDLRPRFDGVPIRWFIGNHGAEGALPFPGARQNREAVAEWRDSLRSAAEAWEGVWVEDKGYSLAVHYRDAPQRVAARKNILGLARYLPQARVIRGKCVVNLVHESAPNKGTALAHLVGLVDPERVLFAGDDDTDEDAFDRDLGIPVTTIRVGGTGPSRARFRLEGQDAMDRMLEVLLDPNTGVTEEEE